MTMIDTANKGVMDPMNIEQQKQARLVETAGDLAKAAKTEPKPQPSVDTVAISDRARQAQAGMKPAAAETGQSVQQAAAERAEQQANDNTGGRAVQVEQAESE